MLMASKRHLRSKWKKKTKHEDAILNDVDFYKELLPDL